MPDTEMETGYEKTVRRLRATALFSSVAFTLAGAATAQAHENEVQTSVQGGQRCITSNGLPDHSTGTFPNSGNPNTISEQHVKLCVSADPKKGNSPKTVRGSIGVGINGVQIRPGTADYYDPSSRRGFSRDRSSGWNLEGLGARDKLGMDKNNAHVDERGLYHYHGVPKPLVESAGSSLIGYAADGFEIHYVGNKQTSSYRLKSGTRPSGPGGAYDGTYLEDWEFVDGLGTLDVCNGGTLNGEFVYFATDSFPFYPRCMWGEISGDFLQGAGGPGAGGKRPRRNGEARGQDRQRASENRRQRGPRQANQQRAGGRRGPPQEAIAACSGQSSGSSCSFKGPRAGRQVAGMCRETPSQTTACVPDRRRPRQ
ncbi:MAG: YHYH protein [Stappiaceae bacterium]